MRFISKNDFGYSIKIRKMKKIWNEKNQKKAKIALIIDEYFGGMNTAFGGYGFVARHLVGKHLPNRHIEIEVILGRGNKALTNTEEYIDGNLVYYLPRKKFAAQYQLKRKKYDAFLSIELVNTYVLEHASDKQRKLLFWIQDPRPEEDWKEIESVKLLKEVNYYNPRLYSYVHELNEKSQVRFITQIPYLVDKAKVLYDLPENVDAAWVPNPVEYDSSFEFQVKEKENMIIYLGRIESVKRGWLFCEIAKRLPQYNFYVLGKYHRESTQNIELMSQYEKIPNLHFIGHVEGKEKEEYLKRARLLINTSIHEALPVSFLEAFSYGTCVVSNQNPEQLTEKFGLWTGPVLGDGFDKVDEYLPLIAQLMEDDELYAQKAIAAIKYIRENHNTEHCMAKLRAELKKTMML